MSEEFCFVLISSIAWSIFGIGFITIADALTGLY